MGARKGVKRKRFSGFALFFEHRSEMVAVVGHLELNPGGTQVGFGKWEMALKIGDPAAGVPSGTNEVLSSELLRTERVEGHAGGLCFKQVDRLFSISSGKCKVEIAVGELIGGIVQDFGVRGVFKKTFKSGLALAAAPGGELGAAEREQNICVRRMVEGNTLEQGNSLLMPGAFSKQGSFLAGQGSVVRLVFPKSFQSGDGRSRFFLLCLHKEKGRKQGVPHSGVKNGFLLDISFRCRKVALAGGEQAFGSEQAGLVGVADPGSGKLACGIVQIAGLER